MAPANRQMPTAASRGNAANAVAVLKFFFSEFRHCAHVPPTGTMLMNTICFTPVKGRGS